MKINLIIGVLLTSIAGFGQVNPVEMGRASNIYSALRTTQNQVYADDVSKLVAFIHRQDITIWGGGTVDNRKLRIDLSLDGGLTWQNDNNVVNSNFLFPALYPNITGYNPTNSTQPLDVLLSYTAPTTQYLFGPFDGFVAGTVDPLTENYVESGDDSFVPGSLCKGEPDEFWLTDFSYNASTFTHDSIRLYKGELNGTTGDIDWTKYESIRPDHNLAISNGSPIMVSPNISFSPNGNDGWVSYLGDLTGGSEGTTNPIFLHSSDGGNSWGTPTEIDLNAINYIGNFPTLAEELQGAGANPMGSGLATTGFISDLTVDINGNPHLFVVVANATTVTDPIPTIYTIQDTLPMLAVDITSTDGGSTWEAHKIATINTYSAQFFSSSGDWEWLDNYTQISRTQDGSRIFYSWADSDTTVSPNFGTNNIAPNLRIAGYRISDGYITCPKWITTGDFLWDGKIHCPTMAPTVLTNISGADYSLPIVSTEMFTNDILEPCRFWYWGADATFAETDFHARADIVDLNSCAIADLEEKSFSAAVVIYPNPTNGLTSIKAPIEKGSVEIAVYDLAGSQTIIRTAKMVAGQTDLDLTELAPGLYTLILTTDSDQHAIKRLIRK